MKIDIQFSGGNIQGELFDTPTAKAIREILPFEGQAQLWGDEIFFDVPVSVDTEPEACADVEIGDLGYWPVGHAFCIFFGKTPVSLSNQPKAASPVNIFGRIQGDFTLLKRIRQGMLIQVKKMED